MDVFVRHVRVDFNSHAIFKLVMAEYDRTEPYYNEVDGFLLPGGFSVEVYKNAIKYVPRSDDLFIATYPKCGTTWAQQIVYLIYNKGVPAENLREFFLRTPFLEMLGQEGVLEMERPSAIKAHLPFNIIPYSPEAKYLSVLRNPKDSCVSFYHHMITDPVFTFQEGTFDRYFEDFITGHIAFGDYFQHVMSWYEHRNDPNVMLITYEELKNNVKEGILKIGKFMGDEWYEMLNSDQEILDNVIKYSGLDFMKSFFNNLRPKGNKDNSYVENVVFPGLKYVREFGKKHYRDTDGEFKLVRQGKVGSWRDILSEDQLRRMDQRIEEKLNGTDLYDYWKKINCI